MCMLFFFIAEFCNEKSMRGLKWLLETATAVMMVKNMRVCIFRNDAAATQTKAVVDGFEKC